MFLITKLGTANQVKTKFMKASIIYLFALMLGAQTLQAQTSVNKAALYASAAKDNPAIVENNKAGVTIKVQRAFIQKFGSQATQNWSAVGQHFMNSFYVDGIRTNALYSKNGYLIYTIAFGTEKQLPDNLTRLVKNSYSGYDITAVTEVNENNRHIWVVQLQNSKKVITARIENEELEEVQQFKRL